MNWAIKYRPQELEQLALSPKIRSILNGIVKNNHMGDFLFYSPTPGSGKTSVAKMLPHLLDMEILFINASKDGNMEMIRDQISKFTRYASLASNGKLVVLDEAENITIAAQESLRGMLEEEKLDDLHYIFTVNNKSKLIEPISDSRLVPLDFTLPKFDPQDKDFAESIFNPLVKYLEYILKDNNIEYDIKELMLFIKDEYPSIRRMVVKMEFSIFEGKFQPNLYGTKGLLLNDDEIINTLKNGTDLDIYNIGTTIENGDFLINYLNQNIIKLAKMESISKLIELINEYQKNNSIGLNYPKVNFLDFLYKLKSNVNWK